MSDLVLSCVHKSSLLYISRAFSDTSHGLLLVNAVLDVLDDMFRCLVKVCWLVLCW